MSLERGSQPARVVLEDAYEFQKTPRNLALHLMISGAVDTSRVVVLRYAAPSRPLLLTYDAAVFTPRMGETQIDNARLRSVWGGRVYRIVLEVKQPATQGSWRLEMRAG
ncbi:MAG TPA: hypothetical protein VNM48_14925 [Chloroflexota bacterium]|nr:hypothetical protein [Chloroflexota bacterium]